MTLKSNTAFRTLSDSGLKNAGTELFGAELPSFETVTAGRYFDELDRRTKKPSAMPAPTATLPCDCIICSITGLTGICRSTDSLLKA